MNEPCDLLNTYYLPVFERDERNEFLDAYIKLDNKSEYPNTNND